MNRPNRREAIKTIIAGGIGIVIGASGKDYLNQTPAPETVEEVIDKQINAVEARFANTLLEGKISSAKKEDYIIWLEGYVKDGNLPTHSYNYPMSRVIDDFFVARDDFEMSPLYGADSISVIVPEGIRFLGGELGHNNLYFMEGHKNKGGFVPVYSDISFK